MTSWLTTRSPHFLLMILLLLLPGLGACGDSAPVSEVQTQRAESGGEGTDGLDSGEEALPDVEAWGRVLDEFEVDGGLDYAGLKEAPEDLIRYLDGLASARPEDSTRERQIAFWINAYNAFTAWEVMRRYPEIESVIQEDGFFDEDDRTVAGEDLTLNQIEQKGLALGDSRMHFAVVCASTGCPKLRGEPYRAETLEEQLAQQTESYLGDTEHGLRYDAGAGVLYLSSIFDWYAEDFGGDAVAWILPRLPEELANRLRADEPEIRYLDYDWSLNYRPRPAS
ncbi:MAG: DUF547 domain-containing protein [Acidobacteriota bacterium]|nr:DUF547 domain-containing protein [Acidobacteriota bacterium]